jgi:hypothetical protein
MIIKKISALMGLVIMLIPLGFLPKIAQAALYEIRVTGTVDEINGGQALESQFSVGQTMDASFIFESSTAGTNSISPSYYTNYNSAISGDSFNIGTYTGGITGGSITVTDDAPNIGDGFSIRSRVTVHDESLGIPHSFNIGLEDSEGSALDSQSIPLDTSDLAGLFQDNYWSLTITAAISGFGEPTYVSGALTSVTLNEISSVPVPPSIFLFATGILGLLLTKRRS